MFCTNCGKQIDKDSKFCQFCGFESNNIDKEKEPEAKKKSKMDKKELPDKSDQLWDKFADLYDAKDDERTKFDEFSSDHYWELIDRLHTNAFEAFIKEKKDELNAQPYKVIEALKNLYFVAVLGGYRFWTAESILNEKKLGKFKSFTVEELADEWKGFDFQKFTDKLSNEINNGMSRYFDFRINTFLEEYPSIKDTTGATIDDLKSSIMVQIIFGYRLGELENKFRK